MTIKEIADVSGKKERTVQLWAKNVGEKIASVGEKIASAGHGKAADFDYDETYIIIKHGLGKNAADMFDLNHRISSQDQFNKNYEQPYLTESFKMMASAFETLAEVVNKQETRLQKIETKIEERAALLPAPKVKPRDHINMMIRKYAVDNNIPYSQAWRELYRSFGYRTNSNPQLCAKNRGMTILDYIETEGQIEILESVAMDVMEGSKNA